MMTRIKSLIAVFAIALAMVTVCAGQTAPAKKALTFHGKVEAVNSSDQSITVNGEKVEGWMDAMTMSYKVDDAAVLKQAKPGDQITATVYEGDFKSLHNVKVVSPKAGEKKKE
jgi:Cu/Ag efflux protein CusF